MRDRRVIYDSEDEHEDFDLGDSGTAAAAAAPDCDERQVNEPTSDSRSTDPEFFRQFYENQQNALVQFIPDTGRDTEVTTASPDRQKSSDPKAKNNSSSITDPTLKSAKKRALSRVARTDFANSTQVTTPEAPSAKQRDVYDFILSDDEEGAPAEPAVPNKTKRAVTAETKRKRGRPAAAGADAATEASPQQLPASVQEPDDEDEPPRPARKKRKSSLLKNQCEVPSDVDLLVIPTTRNMEEPDETREDDNDPASEVQDTFEGQQPPSASFYIAPPHNLTSSQKQEYLRVSGCSELDGEEAAQPQPSPPPPKPQTQGQRSTNTESTIAYTTPSRYCSSAAPLPILDNVDDLATSSVKQQVSSTMLSHHAGPDQWQPQSSPDELSSHIPPSTSRRMKRKRDTAVVNAPAEDESWNSDEVGYSRETYVPRPSHRRSGVEANVGDDPEVAKRASHAGNKREKKAERLRTAQEDSWDSDKIGYHREQYVPRPSRRRSKAVIEDESDREDLDKAMPDTCPPGDTDLEDVKDPEPMLISSGHQAPQQATEDFEGLDADFLAALPADLRQEVISDHIALQSGRTTQASRTRSRGRPSMVSSGTQPLLEETPQPKKRGRKKKEPKLDEAPISIEESGAGPTVPATTAKRKRGRPKKSEAIPPPPAPESDHADPPIDTAAPVPEAIDELDPREAPTVEPVRDVAEAPKAPAKRGRKKIAKEVPARPTGSKKDTTPHNLGDAPVSPLDESCDEAGFEDKREPLRDISNTASQNASAGGRLPEEKVTSNDGGSGTQLEVTPEPKAPEVPRSASTTGQPGKPPVRVGLSKKSRIAPLLKIIRK